MDPRFMSADAIMLGIMLPLIFFAMALFCHR